MTHSRRGVSQGKLGSAGVCTDTHTHIILRKSEKVSFSQVMADEKAGTISLFRNTGIQIVVLT